MFTASLISPRGRLNESLVNGLRKAWGGGVANWLSINEAVEFVLDRMPDNRWNIWKDLCGMESHGIMRVLQYAEQFQSGYMNPKAKPKVFLDKKGIKRVSGNEGIGIPVMKLAYMAGINDAIINEISALSIRDVGYTGRHGAFADFAA